MLNKSKPRVPSLVFFAFFLILVACAPAATATLLPTVTVLPSSKFTATPTATDTPTLTATPLPTATPTRPPIPTAIPTPTATATPPPTPTLEPTPFFTNRTEGRKTGERVGVGNPVQAIFDPDNNPRFNNNIRQMISGVTSLFGYDIILGRDAKVTGIDKATNKVKFYIGNGQTLTRQITSLTHLIMLDRTRKVGTNVASYYHDGGNISDLEVGDLVGLLQNPTDNNDDFWGIVFVQ